MNASLKYRIAKHKKNIETTVWLDHKKNTKIKEIKTQRKLPMMFYLVLNFLQNLHGIRYSIEISYDLFFYSKGYIEKKYYRNEILKNSYDFSLNQKGLNF